jgi:uncharacterized membrane protein YcaP (DUF421 family)
VSIFDMSVPWYEILLRTFVVYLTVLTLLRIAGKRELGQMTPFDLVVILVIANAVQNAMTGGDNSVTGGIIAATTLTVTNIAVGRWGNRIPFFRRLVASEPRVLLRDGTPIKEALDEERIDIEELEMAAREHGIADLAEVTAAVLEEDGSISVIPKEGTKIRRIPRRFRQFRNR